MAKLTGVNFPFKQFLNEVPTKVEGSALFQQSIQQILLTQLGERVMRPTFGSNLKAFVFSNIPDDELLTKIRADVLRAIQENEPRVRVISIEPKIRGTEIVVEVVFRVFEQEDRASVVIRR